MQAFAALSMLLVGVVTGVVGVRLLLVWRRTQQLPELCFGIGFVGGSLGSALPQIGQRLLWNSGGTGAALINGACFALLAASTVALLLATWRIFRPGAAWAGALCIAGSLAVSIAFAMRIANAELAAALVGTAAMRLFLSTRLALFVWTSFEALRYHARLKKRLALGLADPVATQQIFFWGMGGISTAFLSTVIWCSIFVAKIHPLDSVWATVPITIFSVGTSLAMWLAFFPPESLRRRALARAPAK